MPSHNFLFYSPDADASSRTVTLTGEEHHHFARVLRCGPGDTLFVTNGRGVILECRADTVGRSSTVTEVSAVAEDHEAQRAFVLALGTIKKDKFEHAFEQCVELGITRCVPFVSENTQVKKYSQKFLERLHKIALSAIKQSFRSVLPHVGEPLDFDGLLGVARLMPRVVVGRQGAPPPERSGGEDTIVVVGPEAGLTEAEFDALADAGASFAGVSSRRLRSETAAVALAASLLCED